MLAGIAAMLQFSGAAVSKPNILLIYVDDMGGEEKLAVFHREFERLDDPNHPVRNLLSTLDSVEEVRIIREALKK
jgi:hypothetical protein